MIAGSCKTQASECPECGAYPSDIARHSRLCTHWATSVGILGTDVKISREHYIGLCRVLVQSHISLSESLALHQRLYLEAAVELAKGNRGRAAGLAGVHRNTVTRILGKKP